MRIDGEKVVEPGTQVDPEQQRVTVGGRELPGAAPLVYKMLNKPVNVLTTMSDPGGRPTIRQYLPKRGPRLYPVGRLDGDTSGLLILTNDGWLTHRLMHPKYEVPKTYHLTLADPAVGRGAREPLGRRRVRARRGEPSGAGQGRQTDGRGDDRCAHAERGEKTGRSAGCVRRSICRS